MWNLETQNKTKSQTQGTEWNGGGHGLAGCWGDVGQSG